MKEDIKLENKELNVVEMEQVAGGAQSKQPPRGGSSTPLPAKAGCKVYRVVGDDNLTKIAKNNGTTVKAIMQVNDGIITNKNFIRAGFYIYIPI